VLEWAHTGMMFLAPAVALLASFAAQAAPAAQPVPSKAVKPSASKAARPGPSKKAPVPTDAEIERAIRARFAKSKISVNHFTVHVQGGVATIEGRTAVIQHKGTATRLAKTAGAIQVVNKVELTEEAKQRAAANLTSGRRRAQVKRSEVAGRQ
jgi:BON domain